MTTPDDPGYGQPGEPPSLQKPPPAPGYAAPPPGYGAPPQGYGAPPSGYGAPAGYAAPAGYGAPSPYGSGGQMHNGLGTGALVLGIISLVLGVIFVGALFGLLAVILGFVARGRVKRGEANNGGVALAGIITGVIGMLITAGVIVALVVFANSDSVKKLRDCNNRAGSDPVAKQACADQFGKSITG